MELDEKNLEGLAKKIAEEQGVSLVEAASIVSYAMKITRSFAELWQMVHEVVSLIWGNLKNLKIEPDYDIRHTWLIDWDTRRKSQVILKKPKFAAVKIMK